MSDEDVVSGLKLKDWKHAFRPGMPEFAASTFIFSAEADNLLRIAFGNQGPYVNTNGDRESVYTHAVTLSPETAVNLARLLLKQYAEPVQRRKASIKG